MSPGDYSPFAAWADPASSGDPTVSDGLTRGAARGACKARFAAPSGALSPAALAKRPGTATCHGLIERDEDDGGDDSDEERDPGDSTIRIVVAERACHR